MKKAKATGREKSKRRAARKTVRTPKQPVNLDAVRSDISKIVGSQAKEMAKAVMGEGLKGQLAPVKYLFEVSGIYPAPEGTVAQPEEKTLAHRLLRRLGFPTDPVLSDEGELITPPEVANSETEGEAEAAAGQECGPMAEAPARDKLDREDPIEEA